MIDELAAPVSKINIKGKIFPSSTTTLLFKNNSPFEAIIL